ncbi:shikimate kinase [Actinomycetaceae bacterium MB13-C1-2]|nr:shikimate kinase [Actinomycetaceae bacterium MB13-C1-2]
MGDSLVLIGPSGSGKSAVGRVLSDRLGSGLLDASEALGTEETSVTEAFVQDPEDAQRRINMRARDLVEMVSKNTDQRHVVELPPSAPLDRAVRSALLAAREKDVIVIYLDANLETLARRSGLGAAQPGFLGTPRAWFRQLNRTLEEGYQGLYDLHCDTTHVDPDAVVDEIMRVVAIN